LRIGGLGAAQLAAPRHIAQFAFPYCVADTDDHVRIPLNKACLEIVREIRNNKVAIGSQSRKPHFPSARPLPATRFAGIGAAIFPPSKQKVRPMKVNVYVTLKPGVLDPQGKAIHHALEGLGFGGVADVRAGRFIELEVADTVSDADLDAMCAKLLANTVIENYRIERA
jgi:phosphoribosylformylglycinamidine synthase